MHSSEQLAIPGSRALVAVLGLCVALAAPTAARADDGLDRLIAAVDRIDAIQRGDEAPEGGDDRALARTACRALGPFVGEPLQRLLDRAYGHLDGHYDRAQELMETNDGFAGILEHVGERLRAAGLSPEASAAVQSTAGDAYRPGRGGTMASYSVNLHASEVSTAVCRAFNRIEREDGGADARARGAISSAVTTLHGLVIMAALNAPGVAEAPPARAAAAAALGGVVVARGYGGLF